MTESDIKNLFTIIIELEQQVKVLNQELKKGLNPNKLMTIYDIANEYDIDRKFVKQIILSGAVPARKQGSVTKVRRSDFDAYLAKVYSNDFKNDHFFTKPVQPR